ncbi:MAG: hypothetical protein HYY93_04810 [Planctomycetes bacterium]|nr:hypothetical protein [Planctomycetota bacterium]
MRKPTRSIGAVAVIGALGCLLLMFAWSTSAEKVLGTGPLVGTAKFVRDAYHDVIRSAVCRLRPAKGNDLILAVEYAASGLLPPEDRSRLSKEIGEMAYLNYVQDPEVRAEGQAGRIVQVTITCTEEVSSGCSKQTRQTSESWSLIHPAPRPSPPPRSPAPPPSVVPSRSPDSASPAKPPPGPR